jgi:uncharacterized membrane protein YciS (DUF1049 family)
VKFVKWGLFFLLAFIVSFILLRTFSQEAFRQIAPGRVLGYRTPEIPIYYFIAGAFAIGLFIGLFIAIYNYIAFTAEGIKKSKRIKDLEKQVDFLKDQVARIAPNLESPDLIKESFEDTQYRRDFIKDETEEEEEGGEDNNSSDDDEVDSYLG